jgi:RimJ/RimL family protein N-acetyltransferase
MQICETERLVVRQFTLEDAGFIVTLLNSPNWLQFLGDRNIHSLADARQYLINGPLASYEMHGFGLFQVSLKDQTPIGMCGLIKRDGLEDVDVGFALLPEYTRQGYALEAAKAVLDYGYQQLRLPRIVAIVNPDNKGSISLLERLGLHAAGFITLPAVAHELLLFK